jgi:hypothetical protein
MARAVLLIIAACHPSAPPRVTPVAPPKHDLAVAEPVPVQPAPPARNAIYPPGMPIGQLPYWNPEIGIPIGMYRPDELVISLRKSDEWPPCVRRFTMNLPGALRDTVGEALAWCDTSCANGPLVFSPPPHDASYLGIAGTLDVTRRELALEVAYHGDAIDPDRITLIADGVRWTSPRLDFDANAGWRVAHLPLTRDVARAVRRTLDANDAVLRFESARGYEDAAITEDTKLHVRALIDALEEL